MRQALFFASIGDATIYPMRRIMTSNWTAESIPDQAGKVAIVTGANRGIGFATDRHWPAKGQR